jgi:hypothetical protein
MITGWLIVRLVVAAVAFGVGLHLARWRRRSRAQWRAYDQAHGAPFPTRASARARRALGE